MSTLVVKLREAPSTLSAARRDLVATNTNNGNFDIIASGDSCSGGATFRLIGGTLNISDSTFTENSCTVSSGNGDAYGGGISVFGFGTVNIIGSYVGFNVLQAGSASGSQSSGFAAGGGVYASGLNGTMALSFDGSVFEGNECRAGTVENGTIVAPSGGAYFVTGEATDPSGVFAVSGNVP